MQESTRRARSQPNGGAHDRDPALGVDQLRTQRGTLVALATTGVLMVVMTAFFASQSETDAVLGGDDDVVQMGLTGIAFAQIAVVVVGASLITGEFATGMIRTTFTGTQSRLRVLLAKAVLLCVVMFPVALLTSTLAFVVAQPLLHDRGYVAPAYPPCRSPTPAPHERWSGPRCS